MDLEKIVTESWEKRIYNLIKKDTQEDQAKL